MEPRHLNVILLIWKRLCVCQVSTEGTDNRGQTGHSDNGPKCTDFTVTSANSSSSIAHPNLARCRHLHKHCCIYCGSEFKDRNQLSRHVNMMHRDRQFACRQCHRSYVSKCGLTQHVDKVHKKLNRYQCQTCGKGFFGRSLYLDHVAAHTGVKRHTCSICEMKFTNKSSLKAHVLRFHPNDTAHIV